jgi:hypothetical protein
MQAPGTDRACMASKPVQYTRRQVPPEVDRALRKNAQRQCESLNQVALAALSRGLGLAGQPVEYDDLDALAGSWEEDPTFDAVIAEQDRVDPTLWS